MIPSIHLVKVYDNLLEQTDVDAFVNPWNRNFIPRYLLIPHGVSGSLKKVTGKTPWIQLSRYGLLKTGTAVLTTGGNIPQNIIHAVGLNEFWFATTESIKQATLSSLRLALEERYTKIAIPLIGAGVGGQSPETVERIIVEALRPWTLMEAELPFSLEVRIVVFTTND